MSGTDAPSPDRWWHVPLPVSTGELTTGSVRSAMAGLGSLARDLWGCDETGG